MFKDIKTKVQEEFKKIENKNLFKVAVAKDVLFNAYLDCFDDPVIRQEHNCQCCRQFLNNYASIVTVENNTIKTLWDFEVAEPYTKVPKVLKAIVEASVIESKFYSKFALLGTDKNRQLVDGNVITWEHFSVRLPEDKVYKSKESIDSLIGNINSYYQVAKRGYDEITFEAINTVIELIQQNSLYRGQEYLSGLSKFLNLKTVYDFLPYEQRPLFVWEHLTDIPPIRNTVIGTLLTDLSDGKELDYAVTSFESKVAPHNYKRPTALITKAMIEQAEKTIKELGIEKSLDRRFANKDDIDVNKILFVDRTIEESSILASLKDEVIVNPKKLSKMESIHIGDFIEKILPRSTSIEILVENNKVNNFMSLLTATHPDSPNILAWDNPLSWVYKDNLTDSVKERIKKAGGHIEGELRISLEWFNFDDLDLHVVEPSGEKIYYPHKISDTSGGFLDVDMNAGGGTTREAVENILFKDKARMEDGEYEVYVHNFCKRENIDIGCSIEIECRDQIYHYNHSEDIKDGKRDLICTIHYTKKDGIVSITGSPSEKAPVSKEVWNISTSMFHKVSMILPSPNTWGNKVIGNKHIFFILDKAINNENPRGIFNEFLCQDVYKHKKVFEVLGNKLRVPFTENQLSGLGFSTTQRAELICKVTGNFTRYLKILF